MNDPSNHALGDQFYSLQDLAALREGSTQLEVKDNVAATITKGADFVVELAARGEYIYGVNTGFGSLCETPVAAKEMEQLQYNHVVSHACGVGDLAPERISRMAVLIKLLTFRSGRTGITLDTVKKMMALWNLGIIPAIPKKGTVGASGDLAPLAHMALPLLGIGQVYYQGQVREAGEVLKQVNIQPLRLKPKEGLALTNGVQYINAWAADNLLRLGRLIKISDLLAALSIQAFSASQTFYQAAYHQTSHHEERGMVAANLRRLLEGSNHFQLPTCNKSKQDPYSFRCIPQVHGAIRQAFRFGKEIVEKECNSVSDNPLFFAERDQVLFGGALHGESTAMTLDFLAIAASEMANISERRTYQLLSGQRGLPDFLVENKGLNSGLMIIQYTSAALVNQNKVLCTPASVDTIPTCQLQEDHVSMGGTSAYKLAEILDNCEYVLGIELLTAAQAIEFNDHLKLSHSSKALLKHFRETVRSLKEDKVLSEDMETARAFVRDHGPTWAEKLELV